MSRHRYATQPQVGRNAVLALSRASRTGAEWLALTMVVMLMALYPLSSTEFGTLLLPSSAREPVVTERAHGPAIQLPPAEEVAGHNRPNSATARARADRRAEEIASAPTQAPGDRADEDAATSKPTSGAPTLPPPGVDTSVVDPGEPSSGTQASSGTNSGVPVGGKVVFVGDYETGDAGQWKTCQSRDFNGSCPTDQSGFYGMQVLGGGQQRQGNYAARYELRDGDVPEFGGGERAEVSMSDGARVYEGDERWYEFSLKFDQGFTNPTSSFFIVMQWHSGDGSPPMALMVNRSGELQLTNNATNAATTTIGTVRRGEWVDYVLHVKFSNSASVGWAEVHQNGALAVPRHSRATMSSDSSYLKQGIYRSSSESSTAVVWQDGLRVTAP